MPRVMKPKSCSCGRGGMTKGSKFIPGHDTKVYRAILQHIEENIMDLKAFVEAHTNSRVVVEHD